MCNRYASNIRKAGLEKEFYGFEEWSETRIVPVLGNAVLEVLPKSFGPVIIKEERGAIAWRKMRWGLLGPPQFGGAPVTNIRNVKSAHWRPLLGPAHRCLAPFTAFSEYEDASPKGAKVIRWFAPPDRGLLFFAGSGANGAATTAPRKSQMSERKPTRLNRFDVGCRRIEPFVALFNGAKDHGHGLGVNRSNQIVGVCRQKAEQEIATDALEILNDALEILDDDEAGQYVGGYLK